MIPYKNITGNSGVVGYDPGKDFIVIQFVNNVIYRYSYASAGMDNVEKMKLLARSGKGLSTFISRNVKDKYEK